MKTKTLILMLFVTVAMNAQYALGLQITQDGRLALLGDDHGNTSFTPDINAKFVMQGKDSNLGYVVLAGKYEWAQLEGGEYSRFGFEGGYSFHTYLLKADITPLAGFGYALRHGSRYESIEFSMELKIPIAGQFSAIGLINVNQRKELKNEPWRYNLGAGVRYDIDVNWRKRAAKKGTRF